MDHRDAAARLSAWFAQHARPLPWRQRYDPYHVLVSEFVLQQTRMDVGVPRVERFLRRFPTIAALARATENDVLAEWSGLGYYARARNLRKCAMDIVARHGGVVPDDPTALEDLPGIGPYTAGAIASIAYDRPTPSLDGNQKRVFGRLLGTIAGTTSGQDHIEEHARMLLGCGSPRVLNQALMDLGSTVCTPDAPRCDACPLFAHCATRAEGARSPRRASKAATEHWTAVVWIRQGRVWLTRPRGKGLLGTHWLPPLVKGKGSGRPWLLHRFSHRTWNLWRAAGRGAPVGDGRWTDLADLSRLPHGPVTRRFVEDVLNGDAPTRRRRAPSVARGAPRARRA